MKTLHIEVQQKIYGINQTFIKPLKDFELKTLGELQEYKKYMESIGEIKLSFKYI